MTVVVGLKINGGPWIAALLDKLPVYAICAEGLNPFSRWETKNYLLQKLKDEGYVVYRDPNDAI